MPVSMEHKGDEHRCRHYKYERDQLAEMFKEQEKHVAIGSSPPFPHPHPHLATGKKAKSVAATGVPDQDWTQIK
jgi:hypothetical protein